MSVSDTTQDTLTDRLVSTATIAIVECEAVDNSPAAGFAPPSWPFLNTWRLS
jgi:hypothetical protein